jgi:hypothetical protein
LLGCTPRQGCGQGNAFRDNFVCLDVFQQKIKRVGFNPGQIKNFVDEFKQVIAASLQGRAFENRSHTALDQFFDSTFTVDAKFR